ncbi:MAG: hypothetical protein IJ308_04345 [Clostridia bacterium]|nr:hypothetical protein [Clostridia bacterium]
MIKIGIKPKSKAANKLEIGFTLTPSEEAAIYLNCPLPSCTKLTCKRFEEEKRRLKKA